MDDGEDMNTAVKRENKLLAQLINELIEKNTKLIKKDKNKEIPLLDFANVVKNNNLIISNEVVLSVTAKAKTETKKKIIMDIVTKELDNNVMMAIIGFSSTIIKK